MRKNKNHGASMLEFSLVSPFLVALLVGTLIYGTRLIKELELQQVARDTASMSARGVYFTVDSGNQLLVSRLGRELNWPDTGGLLDTSPGVVYVSTIEYLDKTCNTGSNINVCKNALHWVFLRSVAFGNQAMRASNFGAPPPCTLAKPTCYEVVDGLGKNAGGSLLSDDTINNPDARVQNFTYLGTPDSAVAGFQPGQSAFLVEVAGSTPQWNGVSVSYSFAIF